MFTFIRILFVLPMLILMSACTFQLLHNIGDNPPTREKSQDHHSSPSTEQSNRTNQSNMEISKTQNNVTVTVTRVERMNNNIRIHLRYDNHTQKDLHTGLTMSEVKQNSDIYYPVKKDDLNLFRNPGDGIISGDTTTQEAFVTFTVTDPDASFIFKVDPAVAHSMSDIESVGPFQFQF